MVAKSVYRQGADDGLKFGIFLSVLSILLFISVGKSAIASIPSLILIAAAPFVIFRYQRKYYNERNGLSTFSELWMYGMLMCIFGSLICGVVSFVYLKFLEPTLIYDQAKSVLELYESIPEMKNSDFVEMLRIAINDNKLPSAIDYVMQMIWLTTFLGSITSMFLSLIVRAFPCKNK